MSEKAKKIITLIEGILLLPALGLIMTDAIMDIIYVGMGPTLVTSILIIIMSGGSLLMAFSSVVIISRVLYSEIPNITLSLIIPDEYEVIMDAAAGKYGGTLHRCLSVPFFPAGSHNSLVPVQCG